VVFRSRIFRGLQRRGKTKIDSNILIEKTGPMQVTVRAGKYTDVLGADFILNLKEDKTFNLLPGTNNFIALIYNPNNKELCVWHTYRRLDSREPAIPMPEGFKMLQVLVGWGWLVIPEGCTNINNIPSYCFTWIDNVGIKHKIVRDERTFGIVEKPVFYGKGEKTGSIYEFEEIEHFAVRRDENKGNFFACPQCKAVTSDKGLIEAFVNRTLSKREMKIYEGDRAKLEANIDLIKRAGGKICRKCLFDDVIKIKESRRKPQ